MKANENCALWAEGVATEDYEKCAGKSELLSSQGVSMLPEWSECPVHHKPANAVCVEPCRQQICYECGLFGAHLMHSMLPLPQLERQFTAARHELEQTISAMEQTQIAADVRFQPAQLLQEFAEQRTALHSAVESVFQRLRSQLEAQKAAALGRIDLRLQTLAAETAMAFKAKMKPIEEAGTWRTQAVQLIRNQLTSFESVTAWLDAQATAQSTVKKGNKLLRQIVRLGDQLAETLLAALPRFRDKSASIDFAPFFQLEERKLERASSRLRTTPTPVNTKPSAAHSRDSRSVTSNRPGISQRRSDFPGFSRSKDPLPRSVPRPPENRVSRSPALASSRPRQSAPPSPSLVPSRKPAVPRVSRTRNPSALETSIVNTMPDAAKNVRKGGAGRSRSRSRSQNSHSLNHMPSSPIIATLIQTSGKTLDLSGLGISDAELQHVCASIVRAKELRTILLCRNPITDAGLAHLCTAIREMAVSSIDLSGTHCTPQTLVHLAKVVQQNSALRHITFKKSFFDPKKREELVTQFKSFGVILQF